MVLARPARSLTIALLATLALTLSAGCRKQAQPTPDQAEPQPPVSTALKAAEEVDATVKLAASLLLSKKPDEARSQVEKAMALAPNRADVLALAAEVGLAQAADNEQVAALPIGSVWPLARLTALDSGVYALSGDRAPFRLVRLRPGTTDWETLINDCGPDFAVSPDGTKIAFGTLAAQADGTYQINITNLSAGNTFTLATGEGKPGGVSWSPDGTRVAFASCYGGLYTVAAAPGSEPRKLVESLANRGDESTAPMYPVWLDDQRILYSKLLYEGYGPAQIISADSGDLLRELPGATSDYVSPDASMVLFLSCIDEPWTGQAMVSSISGGAAQALTDGLVCSCPKAWSPDSRSALVLISALGLEQPSAPYSEVGYRLWVVDTKTRHLTLLPKQDDNCREAAWGPDGIIYYVAADKTLVGIRLK